MKQFFQRTREAVKGDKATVALMEAPRDVTVVTPVVVVPAVVEAEPEVIAVVIPKEPVPIPERSIDAEAVLNDGQQYTRRGNPDTLTCDRAALSALVPSPSDDTSSEGDDPPQRSPSQRGVISLGLVFGLALLVIIGKQFLAIGPSLRQTGIDRHPCRFLSTIHTAEDGKQLRPRFTHDIGEVGTSYDWKIQQAAKVERNSFIVKLKPRRSDVKQPCWRDWISAMNRPLTATTHVELDALKSQRGSRVVCNFPFECEHVSLRAFGDNVALPALNVEPLLVGDLEMPLIRLHAVPGSVGSFASLVGLPEQRKERNDPDDDQHLIRRHFRPVALWRGVVGACCLIGAFLATYTWGESRRWWWVPTLALITCGFALMFSPA